MVYGGWAYRLDFVSVIIMLTQLFNSERRANRFYNYYFITVNNYTTSTVLINNCPFLLYRNASLTFAIVLIGQV